MEKRRRRPLTKLSVMEFTEFMLQFKRQRGGVGGLDYGQLAKSHFNENTKIKSLQVILIRCENTPGHPRATVNLKILRDTRLRVFQPSARSFP